MMIPVPAVRFVHTSDIIPGLFFQASRLFGYGKGYCFTTEDLGAEFSEVSLPVVPSRWSFGLLRPVETCRGITGRGVLVWGFGRALYLSPKELNHLV